MSSKHREQIPRSADFRPVVLFSTFFAECTPDGAHFVSGMCSSTITRRSDGFNRINELVRVCAVLVLNILQFPSCIIDTS